MVTLDYCSYCKHYRGLIDGWKMYCDAFPEGMPSTKIDSNGKKKVFIGAKKNCNNGIHYEEDEKIECPFPLEWLDDYAFEQGDNNGER